MPLLSPAFRAYADERLSGRSALLAPISGAVEGALSSLEDEDERALMKCYLGTLPLTDVFDTDLGVLASFARQARELRASGPWCRDVPEEVFVHYVAYPRVNNEPLTDAWPAFRERLAGRLEGLGAAEAVLETNYWCCETATYQASDGRTLGPLGVLASGDGRCGEESTYLVTALRSVGIPARQIYTPWWAHCDDNHAWVEAYTGDGWHYLGACEPEPALDRGWFTAASGRAMLVHTRLFGDYGCDFERDAHLLAREGSQVIVNLTDRYAPASPLTVRVEDEAGAPVAGAAVRLQIVNEAGWRDIASLVTDARGSASILVGEGTLRVAASSGGLLAERVVHSGEEREVTLVPAPVGEPACGWVELDSRAPADHPAPSASVTREQAEAGRARKREADRMRAGRVAGLVARAREIAREAGRDDETCLPFFERAFANAPEVARFLAADDGEDRVWLLSTLTDKDFRDLTADVLEDHVLGARLARVDALAYIAREGAAVGDGAADPARAEEIYRRYVLCPRAHLEHLSAYRAFIRGFFSAEQAAAFRDDPMRVWAYVREHTSLDPRHHVTKLVGSPRGALVSGQAAELTRRALFVAICRTFGVPARVSPVDLGVEYLRGGEFVPVERPERTVPVRLSSASAPAPGYFHDWTIARLGSGSSPAGVPRLGFETLDLLGEATFEGGRCTVGLPVGTYLLTTAARLPSGDVQVAERRFRVGEGGAGEHVELRVRQPEVSQMLQDIPVDDLGLADGRDGAPDPASPALRGRPLVAAFLEPGMEPTEHLLNELREEAGRLAEAGTALLLVVRGPAELSDPTLSRTLPVLEDAMSVRVAYDDFSELPERLARRMFVNPEKLPLCVLGTAAEDAGAAGGAAAGDGSRGAFRGRYAAAGYNVGTVDLMLKLMALL